jgi:hypothetical protein
MAVHGMGSPLADRRPLANGPSTEGCVPTRRHANSMVAAVLENLDRLSVILSRAEGALVGPSPSCPEKEASSPEYLMGALELCEERTRLLVGTAERLLGTLGA